MNRPISAQAVVTVTVEVPTGTYGPEWTMGDIIKQASSEGVNQVRSLLKGKGRVVGEPIVRTIVAGEQA